MKNKVLFLTVKYNKIMKKERSSFVDADSLKIEKIHFFIPFLNLIVDKKLTKFYSITELYGKNITQFKKTSL